MYFFSFCLSDFFFSVSFCAFYACCFIRGRSVFLSLSLACLINHSSISFGVRFWGFRSVRESFKNNKDKMEKYE